LSKQYNFLKSNIARPWPFLFLFCLANKRAINKSLFYVQITFEQFGRLVNSFSVRDLEVIFNREHGLISGRLQFFFKKRRKFTMYTNTSFVAYFAHFPRKNHQSELRSRGAT